MFAFTAVLYYLCVLLILNTWGTGLGRIILVSIGIALIIYGTGVIICGISDLIKAVRS